MAAANLCGADTWTGAWRGAPHKARPHRAPSGAPSQDPACGGRLGVGRGRRQAAWAHTGKSPSALSSVLWPETPCWAPVTSGFRGSCPERAAGAPRSQARLRTSRVILSSYRDTSAEHLSVRPEKQRKKKPTGGLHQRPWQSPRLPRASAGSSEADLAPGPLWYQVCRCSSPLHRMAQGTRPSESVDVERAETRAPTAILSAQPVVKHSVTMVTVTTVVMTTLSLVGGTGYDERVLKTLCGPRSRRSIYDVLHSPVCHLRASLRLFGRSMEEDGGPEQLWLSDADGRKGSPTSCAMNAESGRRVAFLKRGSCKGTHSDLV